MDCFNLERVEDALGNGIVPAVGGVWVTAMAQTKIIRASDPRPRERGEDTASGVAQMKSAFLVKRAT